MIHPSGDVRAAIPHNAIPPLPAENQISNERAIAAFAFFPFTLSQFSFCLREFWCIKGLSMGFRLYSLSSAHQAAILVSTFFGKE
jgi:hypothetical protein